MDIHFDATFFALVALLIFVALTLYLKVPSMLAGALDSRSQAIAKELHEARRLREEAERLKGEYLAQKAAAEAEAAQLLETARAQARQVAEDARRSAAEAIERRKKQAEDRIAQAEAQAAADVRAAAADAAIAAAERTLREKMTPAAQAQLVAGAVKDLRAKFG